MKTLAITLAALGLSCAAWAQSTIRYSGLLSAPVPWGDGWRGLDLNGDGTDEFSLMGRYLITMDVPPSGAAYECGISMGTGNQVLRSAVGWDAWLSAAGQAIGPASSLDPVWANTPYWFGVTGYSEDLRAGTRTGWNGPLGTVGSGYLGVCFALADGDHYGWIQVRLPIEGGPFPGEFTPVVAGWAYETRVNTPILAGAVPEPSAMGLLTLGGLLLFGRRRQA